MLRVLARPTVGLAVAASVIGLLFAVGHSMGAPWTPVTGPQESAVVQSMKAIRFKVMGVDRSYWEFYFGFGVSISVYLLALALVLWQTANFARSDARRARRTTEGRCRPR